MRTFKLDEDGDLDFTTGLSMVEGKEFTAQKLRIRMRFFKGEWILDTEIGIPYFQEIFKNKFDSKRAERLFTKAILSTPGVQSLLQGVTVENSENRVMTVSFIAQSDDGPITFDTEFVLSGVL